MRNVIRLVALVVVLVLAMGPNATATTNDVSLIGDVRAGWQESMNNRDLFGMLAWYGPGAVVIPAHAAPRLGAEQIADWHARWMFRADVHYDFKTVSLVVEGSWALEEWVAEITVTPRGDAATAIGDDPMQFSRSGLRVYRKGRAGRWLIDREVWTEDLPAVAELQRF